MNQRWHRNPVQHASEYYGIPQESIVLSTLQIYEMVLSLEVSLRFIKGSVQYIGENGQMHEQHVIPSIACPTCLRICWVPNQVAGILPCCGRIYCKNCLSSSEGGGSVVEPCSYCRLPVCPRHMIYTPNLQGKMVRVHRECQSPYRTLLQAQEECRRLHYRKETER